jgi:hypothetical protein
LYECSKRNLPNARENPNVKERNVFLKGDNLTYWGHIRQHYDIYSKRCKKANIPENHYCIPRDTWKTMQAEKNKEGNGTLDQMFLKAERPNAFSREAVVHAVAVTVADHFYNTPRL